MTKKLLFMAFAVLLVSVVQAQEPCGTESYYKHLLLQNPSLAADAAVFKQKIAGILRAQQNGHTLDVPDQYIIPVVFHFIYQFDNDSFPEAQIKIQLARLNEDYNNLNGDLSKVPAAFTSLIGNMNIKFMLAKTDPNGNPTNGYEYKKTNRVFNTDLSYDDDFMKHSSSEGLDAWDATKYLNVWVCALGGGGLNGYSTRPEGLGQYPALDGVVISSSAFGVNIFNRPGTNYGRTLVHEVGHWLGLYHIWADDQTAADQCLADDEVDDTPKQAVPNYGVHRTSYIHVSCSNGPAGDMWMNYMDYCDHLNRYMFTQGQVLRARAVLAFTRLAVTTSNKHLQPVHQMANVPAFTTNTFTALGIGKNRNIWAGSDRTGLYKFDGTSWAKSNGSMDSYRINHIVNDKNGGIWIAEQGSDFAATAYASGGGIQYYADGSIFTGRRYFSDNANGGLPSRSARSVFIDTAFTGPLPRAWVATMNQLNQLDDTPERGGFAFGIAAATPYFSEITAGLDATVINSGCYTVGGNKDQVFVYATSNFGQPQIVVYNAVTGGLVSSFGNTNSNGALPAGFFARAIYGDVAGNKWIGLESGGVALANSSNAWQAINFPAIFPSGSKVNNNAMAGDRDGNVFIGTTAGLVMYNGAGPGLNDVASFKLFTTADGLPSNNVTALAVDTVLRKLVIATENGITYFDKDCLMKSCEPKIPELASTIKNGSWSDPTVWSNGKVPDCNTIVMVYHTLSVDPDNAVCNMFYIISGANATINRKITMTGGCSQ